MALTMENKITERKPETSACQSKAIKNRMDPALESKGQISQDIKLTSEVGE